MKSIFIMITMMVGACLTTYGQAVDELSNLDRNYLDSVYTQYMSSTQVPGIAIGILKNGNILYSKGFGIKNKDTKEPVTSKSLFHLASVSKTFVATAIMQLSQEEKLELDDPIVKYLPYFEMKDKRYKAITIKQILTHSSGIPDVRD
ncbi:MAG: serine hydrolase domain-containing protein, partial [Bacteroidota bacterium]